MTHTEDGRRQIDKRKIKDTENEPFNIDIVPPHSCTNNKQNYTKCLKDRLRKRID